MTSDLCPNCNSFPLGRLRLVGLWRKTYQVVVRNLWRKGTTGGNRRGFWSQSIVKDLDKESRKCLTDGLREFIRVDFERALDVGALRRGTSARRVLGCDSQGEPG